MANKVTLTFAGDATSLEKASKSSEQALGGVDAAADKSGKQLGDYGTKMGHLGSAVSGAGDALDAIGGSLQAVSDLQSAGAERASRLAHAVNDVEQAQEDYNQALRDGKQATLDVGQAQIDLEQANLDAAVALKDYNTAVIEHGKNSVEAKQASLDLKQSQQDVKQAQEDSAQATRDAAQATIDASAAQIDLNDANREATPTDLSKWAEQLQTITPLLSAVVGVVALITAAQWAWNIAQLASPTTWIILAIVALIAVIVLIATKTTWFQDLWKWAWSGIKSAAVAVWDWLKKLPGMIGSAFSAIAGFISAPFRAAFNFISRAWNNTIGKLSWTIPSWIPGIGGNTISVPKLPTFHRGGVVPGAPGAEVVARLQAGETVTAAGQGGGRTVLEVRSGGSRLDDLLVEILAKSVQNRGGNVQLVLGGRSVA